MTDGFEGGQEMQHKEVASTSRSLVVEIKVVGTGSSTTISTSRNHYNTTSTYKLDKEKEEISKTVPFWKLFSFAGHFDVLLMVMGILGAIGNGLSRPYMTLILGDMINSFGQNQLNHQVDHPVSQMLILRKSFAFRSLEGTWWLKLAFQVSLKFVYLAIGAGMAAFLQVACWVVTGEQQAARIRSLYSKTIIRQDVSFFDTETNTGEVVNQMSGDTVLIQDAMGEKVTKCILLFSSFVQGYVIAFVKGWLLTFVTLSSIPLVVMAGGVITMIVSKISSKGKNSFVEAATLVEQTLGSI